MNNKETLNAYRSDDVKVQETLLNQYAPIVRAQIRLEEAFGNIYESDKDDLIQEGMIALDRAIRSYNPDLNVSLGRYAKICVRRHIRNYLVKNGRIRERKTQFSLDSYLNEEDSATMHELVDSPRGREVDLNEVFSSLTPLEKKVIALRMSGYSYQETADRLHVSRKKVDNVIQKLRKKHARFRATEMYDWELTEQEKQIVQLHDEGKTYREIADILQVSYENVRNDVKRIRRKKLRTESAE